MIAAFLIVAAFAAYAVTKMYRAEETAPLTERERVLLAELLHRAGGCPRCGAESLNTNTKRGQQ